MSKPRALVTNDDGIDCGFLHALANAMSTEFEVVVIAPRDEQSWAGRSFSRRGKLEVEARTDLPWTAWSVAGTPSDCVNIGLGHLLESPVDLVASGINVGFNVTLPLLLTSGTVAAALEAALWGRPSVAFSQAVPPDEFENVKRQNGHSEGSVAENRDRAADHAAQFALGLLNRSDSNVTVHNVNYPSTVHNNTIMEETQLGFTRLGSLFAPKDEAYQFAFPMERTPVFNPEDADIECLKRGHISHTLVDYTRLGRR